MEYLCKSVRPSVRPSIQSATLAPLFHPRNPHPSSPLLTPPHPSSAINPHQLDLGSARGPICIPICSPFGFHGEYYITALQKHLRLNLDQFIAISHQV